MTDLLRWIFTIAGGIMAILEPTLPYLMICTVMIFADCYTAWQLARRARKFYPDRISEEGPKFKSHYFGKVVGTILKSYSLILMAYMIQCHITDSWPIDLTKVAAGAICFWQLWSILENESSCNGSRWAKLLQKILVDKTSRHFDIDLSDLIKTEEKQNETD